VAVLNNEWKRGGNKSGGEKHHRDYDRTKGGANPGSNRQPKKKGYTEIQCNKKTYKKPQVHARNKGGKKKHMIGGRGVKNNGEEQAEKRKSNSEKKTTKTWKGPQTSKLLLEKKKRNNSNTNPMCNMSVTCV